MSFGSWRFACPKGRVVSVCRPEKNTCLNWFNWIRQLMFEFNTFIHLIILAFGRRYPYCITFFIKPKQTERSWRFATPLPPPENSSERTLIRCKQENSIQQTQASPIAKVNGQATNLKALTVQQEMLNHNGFLTIIQQLIKFSLLRSYCSF